jgi:hypothetical protein
MLSNDFLESKHSYKVTKRQMPVFLRECEEHGLVWNHGKRPTEFNPIQFYAGENIQYLAPIQKVDDRNKVYIKCFYGRLYFSFCYDWSVQPAAEYGGGKY